MQAVELNIGKKILPDGIIIYHIPTASRPVTNAWYQDVAGVFAHAIQHNQPARLLYDVRKVGMFSPHVIKRAGDLGKLDLPDDWRVATVVNSGFVKQLVETIKTISLLSADYYSRSRVFNDMEAALEWLRRSPDTLPGDAAQ
jgi:hypothetical protein